MSGNLGDLLEAARRRRFVGRERELACFDDALHGRGTCRVLFVHGEGGIGKTTLLHEFAARVRVAGRIPVQIDGRDIDAAPPGVAAAIRLALGDRDGLPAGAVLLVDGYEQLTPVDGWLRDTLLPTLSADTVVVLAGRDPPSAPWRTDPGWGDLTAVHRLRPLGPAEGDDLLAHAGVAPDLRPHLLTLARGHPLTMALLADQAAAGRVPGSLADAPDLISALLESFLRDVPGEAYLTGLATCAVAWLTTEDLLRRLVGADAPAVWRWLAGQPFITSGPHGLSIHDLVRDVLHAEFERRAPEPFRRTRWTVYIEAVSRLRAAPGPDAQLHAQQLFFLLRSSPLAGTLAGLRAQGSTHVVTARPDEHDQVCDVIERFEGPASADLARAWLTVQPQQLSVVRSAGRVAGLALNLLCPTGSGLEEQDPVVRAVLAHVAREAPARPGELVDISRFLSGADEHQRDRYALLAGPVSSIVEWLTHPLAWSFIVTVDPDHWGPFFDYMAFARLVEVDSGGRRHVVYGIDWRRIPVDTWFDLMHERGRTGATGPPPAALLRPPPLDRARFGAAVRAALPALHRPDRLAGSPLLGTALAATTSGPDVDRLRAVIEDGVARLGAEPRGDRLRAVLDRTYLRAAPSQEAAAQILGLPLSTYRRYLAKALDHLTDLLWTVEIGDVRPDTRS
ncbi:hypothetical protein FHR83_009314 [Actinoplanes campanulatus]|uniref:Orc1-like AAA ATPase domain-containing protein n=1 Tax=Actinoplanes campanulatus TaxID=113559 RepID=A0A7W5ASN6_9ACTN|nr:AAA family ATPase [Actinoplanes campanulatus]MBB3101585.1 hypothetical protein [Actinoplanes campanulatus]GGN51512.1 hypothetical protein GCM10010109_91680 [Actinoplanes campanulatus]GID42636.1 hypothetical protein Aca09nite_91420 [Actinoplanes campanulatus]